MKLAFKNRRMRLLSLGSALFMGLLAAPCFGFSGENTVAQPEPDQQLAIQLDVQEFTKTIKLSLIHI